MRWLILLTVAWLVSGSAGAKEFADKFIPVLQLPPGSVTREKVTAMLGNPSAVEEGRKTTLWRYERDKSVLKVRWRSGQQTAEKVTFSNNARRPVAYDPALAAQFQEGKLNVGKAVAVLGAPSGMEAKKVTQTLRYAYKNSFLRLFFRNGLLVDYTLIEKGGQ